jgi:endonuclease/exonuclease/phosphatase family metal-dependent hydrolase
MKLVTYNTQWCCGNDGTVSPERIVQVARNLADFDVLCLQEIAVNYPRLEGNAGHDQPAILAGLLPGFQLFFGAAVDEWTPTASASASATSLPPGCRWRRFSTIHCPTRPTPACAACRASARW